MHLTGSTSPPSPVLEPLARALLALAREGDLPSPALLELLADSAGGPVCPSRAPWSHILERLRPPFPPEAAAIGPQAKTAPAEKPGVPEGLPEALERLKRWWPANPMAMTAEQAEALTSTLLTLLDGYGMRTSLVGGDGLAAVDLAHAEAAIVGAAATSDETAPPGYLIVQGELEGFGAFIYDISEPEGHRGQARMLRGRSFYCLLVVNAFAELLRLELNLPATQILMRGGELFQLLVPDTQDARTCLQTFHTRMHRWLHRTYQGSLGFLLSWIEVSGAQLAGTNGGITAALVTLKQRVARASFQPLAGLETSDLRFASHPHHLVCTLCGCDYEARARQDNDTGGRWTLEAGWPGQWEDSESFHLERCASCTRLYKLGGWLTRSQWVLGFSGTEEIGQAMIGLRNLDGGEDARLFYLRIGPPDCAWWWIFSEPEDAPGTLRQALDHLATQPLKAPGLYSLGEPRLDVLPPGFKNPPLPIARRILWAATTAPLAPRDADRRSSSLTALQAAREWGLRVLDFDELSQLTRGAPLLAACKLDLDRFGIMSIAGLPPGQQTLAHQLGISRSMGRFFLGELNRLLGPATPLPSPPSPAASRLYQTHPEVLMATWHLPSKVRPSENARRVGRELNPPTGRAEPALGRPGNSRTAESWFSLEAPDPHDTNDRLALSRIYVFYVGGDDVFLAGPWDALLEAVWIITMAFSRYLGVEPDRTGKGEAQAVTFSAGVTLFQPGFPVRLIKRDADHTLDADAKERGERNAFAGLGGIMKWYPASQGLGGAASSFAEQYALAQRLTAAVLEHDVAEDEEKKGRITRQFLHRLLALKRDAFDQGDVAWRWRLPYLLAKGGLASWPESLKRDLTGFLDHFELADFPLTYALLRAREGE